MFFTCALRETKRLLGSGSGFLGFSSDPDLPKAYLNYHYFDTDHNYITSGFVQVSAGANGAFEELSLTLTTDQQGYVYIYVANETQDDFNVFFDDVEVEHSYSPIVQAQSFYPFGATFGEYRRALSKPNRFLFNQGTGDKTFLTERQLELQVDIHPGTGLLISGHLTGGRSIQRPIRAGRKAGLRIIIRLIILLDTMILMG